MLFDSITALAFVAGTMAVYLAFSAFADPALFHRGDAENAEFSFL